MQCLSMPSLVVDRTAPIENPLFEQQGDFYAICNRIKESLG